jgi:4-hydroxy-tetrahydrodipicolinate synthase
MTAEIEVSPEEKGPPSVGALPRGVVASSVTPMSADGTMPLHLVGPHIDWLIGEGVNGISPLGSSGEFVALSSDERKAVLEAALEANNGRVHTMAGTHHYSTSETIELSRHAEAAGADSLLIVPPYYMRPSNRQVLDHYRRIADQVGLPIVLYHNVTGTRVDLSTDDLLQLISEEVIAGVKVSNTDPDRVCQLLQAAGESCRVYVGLDTIAFEGLCHGAHGWISGIPSVVPRRAREFYDTIAVAGDLPRARALWEPLSRLMRFQFEAVLGRDDGPHWLSVAKETLNLIGPYIGDPIAPLQKLSKDDRKRLADILTELQYPVRQTAFDQS